MPRVPLRDSHPLWSRLPTCSCGMALPSAGPTTPVLRMKGWFGLLPFRSPLLRESRLISFRRATEMFQFTRCPPSLPMCSAGGLQTSLWRGCPIRNLRVHGLDAAPPERFVGLHVLLRPFAPRHPPRTLSRLFSSFVTMMLDGVFGLTLCFNSCCALNSLSKIEGISYSVRNVRARENPQPLKSGNQCSNCFDAPVSRSTWE